MKTVGKPKDGFGNANSGDEEGEMKEGERDEDDAELEKPGQNRASVAVCTRNIQNVP